ncbi:MAG: HAD-IC family P-type ATPase [Pseudomonadota bacterium]
METLVPVHVKIKGRARFAVTGLKRSELFKHRLMLKLMSLKSITSLSASSLTGRILVHYDVSFSDEEIAAMIRDTIRQIRNEGNSTSVNSYPQPKSGKKAKTPKVVEKTRTLTLTQQQAIEEPWHQKTGQEAAYHFGSDFEKGIPQESIQTRRQKFGDNVLPKTESRTELQIFLGQMNSLPVYLLGAVAGISIIMGGILDAAIVFGVVLANAAIGYVTESKAEKNIDSLNKLIQHMAEVIRDGKPMFIHAEEVVPGDILVLKPGSFVPADCRIIYASDLTIDESMLTGESLPVEKHANPLDRADIALADRKNMTYMGTCITGGQGLAVVVATGRNTEIGRLKLLLNESQTTRSPIERQLDAIGDQLIYACLAICGGVFAMGFFMGFGFLNMLRMSISLAAAAVPEGLPSIATVNFALGISRMKKNNVIVRHLPAAETLGAIQTICLDKTGTITMNQMRVTSIYAGKQWFSVDNVRLISPENFSELSQSPDLRMLYTACALCCETRINGRYDDGRLDISGSSTENALIEMVDRAGIDVKAIRKQAPLLKINHRSEKRLFMSTFHRTDKDCGQLIMVKGSPLEVLSRCDYHLTDGQEVLLTQGSRLQIEQANEFMAGNALRVLGFAFRKVNTEILEDMEVRMTWLGLIGLTDPPRDGIKDLIAQFHQAGVRTVMITGDQQISARAIASQLNLSGNEPLEILDATELIGLDNDTLVQRARTVHVYSRVSPSHKLKIVKAIQASGQTVAMTGDGINDGPALKAADIGIAMGGSGTDLARDVADVVLTQDNLELLAASLAEGRCIYQNIRKSAHYSLSTNISEIQLMTVAIALGMGSPLNVMQLLWINMISDILPGLALSFEKPEVDVLTLKPRNAADPLFSKKDFSAMFLESSIITSTAMGTLFYGMARYGTVARAGGMAFQSLAIGQLLHSITCRSESAGILTNKKLPRNSYLNWAIGISLAAQIFTMVFPPLRSLLGLAPITLVDGLTISAASTLPLLANELNKAIREKTDPTPGVRKIDRHSEERTGKVTAGNLVDISSRTREEMEAGLKKICN